MMLQEELEIYKIRNDIIKNLLTKLVKENLKLEKKINKTQDELMKLFFQVKLLHVKETIDYIENAIKEASDLIALKKEAK